MDQNSPSNSRDASTLRSSRWFAPDDLRSFGHRSRIKGTGLDDIDYRDRPIVAILNTWSDLNTCHSHFPNRVQEVKRGILQAGGFPVEIPVLSLGEMLMKPTTMLYRNLLAMECEEVLRCHPVDSAVLMGGCDKTVPGLLMGAISADIPSIFFPAGPMLNGRWKNQTLGSGYDAWKYWAERCAGNLDQADWTDIENGIARSAGTCMTMGTASTMACVTEALGMSLPNASSIPAVTSDHSRLAVATGRQAVQIAWNRAAPSKILSQASFDNAVIAQLAIGGSTNAIVHLIALAGRAGFEVDLKSFDRWSQIVPVLANLRPCGRYLMEDFYRAGGLNVILSRCRDLIDDSASTISGLTLADQFQTAEGIDDDVIRTRDNPVSESGGTCVLFGNLAPDGCVIKTLAATPELLLHRGPAVVFESAQDLRARINDPNLRITSHSVLVLRSAGPIGAPGFPEWGQLPIPDRLLREGVRDMVRISDARMSGTSYGTCVLHVSPESQAGGPLAIVRDGDPILLDVANRLLKLEITDTEIERRLLEWKPNAIKSQRGYHRLFSDHIMQADRGCDFDFLVGRSTFEPDIY